MKLSNSNTTIEYNTNEKQVSGRDLTDRNNEPAFYTKSKRGLKKAFDVLKSEFNNDTTMRDAMNVLSDNKIKTHYWCMMD